MTALLRRARVATPAGRDTAGRDTAGRDTAGRDTAGRDTGGIVLGWLTKLTVILALAGVALFEAISIGTTKASLADQGQLAARSASETWQLTRNLQQSYLAAQRTATEANPKNVVATEGFRIEADGTVRLVLRREAPTLVLYRWSRTRQWTKVSATAAGLSVS